MAGGRLPLRLGLIGCGRWGKNILRTANGLANATVQRVASSNPHTATLVPPECAVSGDWRDVVRADDIDAVLIATPPATHADIMLTAIAHGKPFFVEKPMTLDSGSAANVCAAAEAAGVYGMVDHIHLFSPAFRKLCELSASLGPIQRIDAAAGKNAATETTTPVLWDWGPHDVAMCLTLLGQSPDRIAAVDFTEQTRTSPARVELTLGFSGDDVPAALSFSNHLPGRYRVFRVTQRDGVLSYEDTTGAPRLTFQPEPPHGAAQDIPLAAQLPLDIALGEFCDAVVTGRQDSSSLHLGLETVNVIEMAAQTITTAPRTGHLE